MMLTGKCTDHSAIPGHNSLKWLHTETNFYPGYSCLPLGGLLSILKLGQRMKYSHCSPESQNIYRVLLLQRTSCNKVSSFSHRVFFSLKESGNHRKPHQPKHPGKRSHTDGFCDSKRCYQEVFWEMQRKSSVSELKHLQSRVRRVR